MDIQVRECRNPSNFYIYNQLIEHLKDHLVGESRIGLCICRIPHQYQFRHSFSYTDIEPLLDTTVVGLGSNTTLWRSAFLGNLLFIFIRY